MWLETEGGQTGNGQKFRQLACSQELTTETNILNQGFGVERETVYAQMERDSHRLHQVCDNSQNTNV